MDTLKKAIKHKRYRFPYRGRINTENLKSEME